MNLNKARVIYQKCVETGSSAFIIRRHCWADHMERTFTKAEILRLLLCPGRLTINHLPSAKPNSFLWVCFDDYARRVEIAVIIEDEMIQATAISAFRKV